MEVNLNLVPFSQIVFQPAKDSQFSLFTMKTRMANSELYIYDENILLESRVSK